MRALFFDPQLWKPYSLRRGGATHLYQQTLNWSLVRERGRWNATSTARIYINEGMAEFNRAMLTSKQVAVQNLFLKTLQKAMTQC